MKKAVLFLTLLCVLYSCSNKTFESITVITSPVRTVYSVGDKFNPFGMTVVANFSDSTSEEITDFEYDYSALTIKDTFIVISYTYEGVTKTVNVLITVIE